MIFYHPQLMHNERELCLYLVTNPVTFTRYEDHEAAIQIGVYDLVEQAIKDREDPVTLIEGYLDCTYNGGREPHEIAEYLLQCEHLLRALHNLREHWSAIDDTLPEDSRMYASGTTREQAVEAFSTINLRTWLEALSKIYHD